MEPKPIYKVHFGALTLLALGCVLLQLGYMPDLPGVMVCS